VRYSSLTRTFPEHAEALFQKAEADMRERYAAYKRMAGDGTAAEPAAESEG
jgi:pyruvate-ferredoxin/flavodoxin oxidoreductase